MDTNLSIAKELNVDPKQTQAAIELLDNGATVPFIARYRKEATGGLDDAQLRTLEERLQYLRELEERRATVLKSIAEQDKLTPELEKAIKSVESKTLLEDLYRPYMPKRRTKAQIAREAGLEPLAFKLLQDPTQDPETQAAQFINKDKDIGDNKSALDGARQILMEHFAEDAALVGQLREYTWQHGVFISKLVKDQEQKGAKFRDYFDFREPIHKIPSHRALALFRGQKEGFLSLKVDIETEQPTQPEGFSKGEQFIADHFSIRQQGQAADAWLSETVRWAWKVKLSLHIDLDLKKRLREAAELEAINVFTNNLHDLLLAAPAGCKTTIGLDPGIRTGVKLAVIDATGKVLHTTTIYPHQPKNQWDQSIHTLAELIEKFNVELISIGNGTASRETDKLVGDLCEKYPQFGINKVMVSEAGASVYSASETASREFPDMDVSLRGAVSIARRLQDPLAELVKIDPKSIGVGQYQHDLNQVKLSKSLDNVVEDCVNAVGVDLNTASASLLNRVSGLNSTIADNIVAFRDKHGRFNNREELKQVPRLGPKAFEQSAGFLRIQDGDNPLDTSAVHPEAYPIIHAILENNNRSIKQIIGDTRFLDTIAANDYTNDSFGLPTVMDILNELKKPGRDPRPEFKTASFKENVNTLADLKIGMQLEGVVSNVTNFGAFVDIGVHQDGLVHVSQLADKFVSDPRSIVKAGQVVKVTVTEVDEQRKRIALSMRSDSAKENSGAQNTSPTKPAKHSSKPKSAHKSKHRRGNNAPPQTAMANAFAQLGKLKK